MYINAYNYVVYKSTYTKVGIFPTKYYINNNNIQHRYRVL